MDITIRQNIVSEEFDYQKLLSVFSDYVNPKQKISLLLKKQDIIRVKKGLYIFNEKYRNHLYSKELLANLIYGPSVVSSDYMLFYYGLIPERVEDVTSTAFKRNKSFLTPIGTFSYTNVPEEYYAIGLDIIKTDYVSFFAATRERAIADKIRNDKKNIFKNYDDVSEYLFNDLRIDEDEFLKLNCDTLFALAKAGKSEKIMFCAKYLKKVQK